MSERTNMRSYPEVITKAWTVCEMLMRLGFAAEDVFFAIARNGEFPTSGYWAFVLLRTQGKEFKISISPLASLSQEEAENLWAEFGQRYNARAFSPDEIQEVYFSSQFVKDGAQLLMGLTLKGFTFPGRPDARLAN